MEIKIGKLYKNKWDQVVEVTEINDVDICVLFVDDGFVDVFTKEDFESFFKPLKNGCK